MSWNTTENKNIPMLSGDYLITVKTTEVDASDTTKCETLDRRVVSAHFKRYSKDCYVWCWEDAAGENTIRNSCEQHWDSFGSHYAEEITAWMNSPEPFKEKATGYWKGSGYNLYCSICGGQVNVADAGYEEHGYCPHCGHKMR